MIRGGAALVPLFLMVATAHAQLASWVPRAIDAACSSSRCSTDAASVTPERYCSGGAPRAIPPPSTSSPAKGRSRTGGAILVGAGYRSLYGVPYAVATANFLLGVELRHATLYSQFGIEVGGPDTHLPIVQLRFGFTPEGKIGRVRLGGGSGIGVTVIHRATDASLAGGLIFYLHAIGSVDLYARGNQALVLGIDVGMDVALFLAYDRGGHSNDVSPTVTGFFGARL
jgi:hypothetical protein